MNVSHVTRRNKARNIYGWVMPHIRMSGDALPDTRTNSLFRLVSHISRGHVTHTDGCCHTVESSASHVWIRHVKRMNTSRHTFESIMSRTSIRHVTHMNEPCHTHNWVMSHTRMSRDPYPRHAQTVANTNGGSQDFPRTDFPRVYVRGDYFFIYKRSCVTNLYWKLALSQTPITAANVSCTPVLKVTFSFFDFRNGFESRTHVNESRTCSSANRESMHIDESRSILNKSRTQMAQSWIQENRASESYEFVTYEFVTESYGIWMNRDLIWNGLNTPMAQSRIQENRASESYEFVTNEFVIESYGIWMSHDLIRNGLSTKMSQSRNQECVLLRLS